jgi:isopentenyl-diphosphate delta-isomerase
MSNELLILVDENDNEVGLMEKLAVHQKGLLHRAFSLFVFNSDDELLLQQRADEKYHSPGLWSNTCCSHPNSNEILPATINRRLKEEMGMQAQIEFQFSFIYQADFGNGLKEHEFDHVYFGRSDAKPIPNEDEIKDWKYMSLQKLKEDVALNPQCYSSWLKICLPEVIEHYELKSMSLK